MESALYKACQKTHLFAPLIRSFSDTTPHKNNVRVHLPWSNCYVINVQNQTIALPNVLAAVVRGVLA